MKLRTTHRILGGVAGGALCIAAVAAAPAIEEVLTPASYFECQIAAQQATLAGMQEWAQQRNRTDLTEQRKQASAQAAQERVSLAMYQCGRQNGGTLGAYANRHADELAAYLAGNPRVKARLDAVGKQIATQSAQMPVVSPSAKR